MCVISGCKYLKDAVVAGELNRVGSSPPSEVPSTRAPITAWIGSFRITFGGLGRATRTDFGLERRAGTSVGNSAVLPSPSDLDSPFPFLRCLSLASHRRLASPGNSSDSAEVLNRAEGAEVGAASC